jgi:hypothetical protein
VVAFANNGERLHQPREHGVVGEAVHGPSLR